MFFFLPQEPFLVLVVLSPVEIEGWEGSNGDSLLEEVHSLILAPAFAEMKKSFSKVLKERPAELSLDHYFLTKKVLQVFHKVLKLKEVQNVFVNNVPNSNSPCLGIFLGCQQTTYLF